MINPLKVTGLTALVLALAAGAATAGAASGLAADKAQYSHLSAEMAELEQAIASATAKAAAQARAASEDAPPPANALAELEGLLRKQDRLDSRMLLLEIRHGWPRRSDADGDSDSGDAEHPREEMRHWALAVGKLRVHFAHEARAIAAQLELPPIPANHEEE